MRVCVCGCVSVSVRGFVCARAHCVFVCVFSAGKRLWILRISNLNQSGYSIWKRNESFFALILLLFFIMYTNET